jgi:hypothetical protein
MSADKPRTLEEWVELLDKLTKHADPDRHEIFVSVPFIRLLIADLRAAIKGEPHER